MIDFVELKTADELKIVRDIAADIWPKTFRSILSAEQILYMMKMMYSPEVMEKELAAGFHFEAVRSEGRFIGYLSCSPCAEKSGTLKLHKVYLLEEFHGKGIGTQMLIHAEEQARRLGFRTLRLNVNKHNERAKRAYLRNGFRTVESVKNDIGGGFFMDDFVMEKELSGTAGQGVPAR